MGTGEWDGGDGTECWDGDWGDRIVGMGWDRWAGAVPCPTTCRCSLEEVQILAHQVGEEPEAQALTETRHRQPEEPPTAPGKQHTGGTWGHGDIRDVGDMGTGPGNAATHLAAPAATTIPTAPAVSPSPLLMASSTFPVTYGPNVSPGCHQDHVTIGVTTDTGGP